MSQFPVRYDGRKCFAPCPPGPCHCRDAVRTVEDDPSLLFGPGTDVGRAKGIPPQSEQVKTESADDQDWLSGKTACDLSGEGSCEACQ